MPRLIIRTEPSFGLGSAQNLTILVDGEDRASLSRDEIASVRVASGEHVVTARLGSQESSVLNIQLEEQDEIRILCGVRGLFSKKPFLEKKAQGTIDSRFRRRDETHGDPPKRPTPYATPQWSLVLGVPPAATNEELRAAYLSLIKKYHPDVAFSFDMERRQFAESRAREINAAYSEALSERRLLRT